MDWPILILALILKINEFVDSTTTTVATSSTGCPTGWTRNGTSCYLYVASEKTFASAQDDCINRGSNLVSLNDQAEFNFILQFKQSNIWVGASVFTPLNFHWLDESDFSIPWCENEPNNKGKPPYGYGQACAQLNSGCLVDSDCQNLAYSICEKAETDCASGWNRFLENCYYKLIANLNYGAAYQKCKSYSSSLVVVNSSEEWNFIKNITYGSYGQFWVGAIAFTPQVFNWIDPSAKLTIKWCSGTPSSDIPSSISNGCTKLTTCFNFYTCDSTYEYICEKTNYNFSTTSIQTTTTTPKTTTITTTTTTTTTPPFSTLGVTTSATTSSKQDSSSTFTTTVTIKESKTLYNSTTASVSFYSTLFATKSTSETKSSKSPISSTTTPASSVQATAKNTSSTGSTDMFTEKFSTLTTISNLKQSLMNLSNIAFQMDQINIQVISSILESNLDSTSCLVQCSNHGKCKFSSSENKFVCECDLYYTGVECQTDLRPCSDHKCLNNGTCVENMTDISKPSYFCDCGQFYEGEKCEYEIDICKNETCSQNGKCINKNHGPKCECFSLYEGEKCETTSEALKTIKNVISVSSIIAIVCIICFYLWFILIDISNQCILRPKPSVIRNSTTPNKQRYIN